MYKHQECQFYISGDFIFPKDIKNLHVNKEPKGGPILHCPIDRIPTYRGMIELQKKNKNWSGTDKDIGEEWFYDKIR